MTKRDVAILACRILAICAWLDAVAYVPAFFELADPIFNEDATWSMLDVFMQLNLALPLVLFSIAGAFLWKWSGLIAAWMVGHDLQDHQFEPESNPQRLEARDLHVIAFSTLGLYVLIDLIPTITYYANTYVYARPVVGDNRSFQSWLLSTAIEIGARLFLGIWLLFGARGFVALLRKLRTAGVIEPK